MLAKNTFNANLEQRAVHIMVQSVTNNNASVVLKSLVMMDQISSVMHVLVRQKQTVKLDAQQISAIVITSLTVLMVNKYSANAKKMKQTVNLNAL